MPKIDKSEINFKKNFCEKYFDKGTWDLDVLHEVDVHLKDKKGNTILYIESKTAETLKNEADRRKALAQVILTNKKQKYILTSVALIYQDQKGNDILEEIDCSDDSIMYNNDINWKKEKASNPSQDAIDRINDRIVDKITRYKNDEIKTLYNELKNHGETQIAITHKNFKGVFNRWKNEVKFNFEIKDEQDLIYLFFMDMLNGTKYENDFTNAGNDPNADVISINHQNVEKTLQLEGTDLYRYRYCYDEDGRLEGIIYAAKQKKGDYYEIVDREKYAFFWNTYKRPPEKKEFSNIMEHSATLYSEKYRKDTGGEYTPSCFVKKQNEILREHYNLDEFIVFDPCAGVGNLENDFGKEYKQYCYLSTLERIDVNACLGKGFENAIQYDYLKNNEQPKFKYKGLELDVNEICKRENRKLMVVMNPPYQNKKGWKNNLAIEFFNKVLKLKPQVIVFYYMTGSFHRDEINNYINSGYKILSHIFSNAKDTFQLSEWSISQIIFDREKGESINKAHITADRYELIKDSFIYKGTYTYNNLRPNLFYEMQNAIKKHDTGMILGNVSYLNDVIKIGNGGVNRGNNVTTDNLRYCLLSKGLIFNTHHHYFELNSIVYKGTIDEIKEELFNDAIMFSQFYIGILFTNKGQKNYIMPFTAEELGCSNNDLNVLFAEDVENQSQLTLNYDKKGTKSEQDEEHDFVKFNDFDFREFLSQFTFSDEAKALYNAALKIFRYYHSREEFAKNRDWNDSFYDITNALMGKDASSFKELQTDNDTRITKVKTTKGTKGFGRNTIKYVVPSESLPIFTAFFDARDVLARKINRQLVQSGLLLWERENIY